MSIAIVPFTDEHLEPAAALLAARHRRMRGHEPLLPVGFEDASNTAKLIEKARADATTEGLALLNGGRLAGYVFWEYVNATPDSYFSPFQPPDAVEVSLAGLAIDPNVPGATRRLYAAASAQWVRDGRGSHEIGLPIFDRTILDEFYQLGFGQLATFVLRETSAAEIARGDVSLEMRQATLADLVPVCRLAEELWSSLPESPVHMPWVPESIPNLRAQAEKYLRDSSTPVWLAVRDEEPAALQLFITPESPEWFTSRLHAPERGIYLFWASTSPRFRGTGINTALLARTLDWARGAGYEACCLHHSSASFAAEYWERQGFRPVNLYLRRRIDPRAVPSKAPDC